MIVIQLCDLHLTTADPDGAIARVVDALRRAVRRAVPGHKEVILAFAGDIAQAGKKDEYTKAIEIFSAIRQEVLALIGPDDYLEIVVPGNHDCDRDKHDSIRQLIVADPANLLNADATQINKCLDVQADYRDFVGSLEKGAAHRVIALRGIAEQLSITIGARKLRLNLLNSAWASSKADRPGTVVFPTQIADAIAFNGPADLVLTVLHHHYAWYAQATRNDLLKRLEGGSDLILTGHEHVADTFQKIREQDRPAFFVEGQALFDRERKLLPAFTLIEFADAAGTFAVRNWELNGDGFEEVSDRTDLRLGRQARVSQQPLTLKGDVLARLNDAENNIKHPRAKQPQLSDLYVYPSLTQLTGMAGEKKKEIPGEEAVDAIMSSPRTMVIGDDKCGKTSLGKMLVHSLLDRGIAAIFLTHETKLPSDETRLRKMFDDVAERMYAGGAQGFFELPVEKRAIIVDDIDRLDFPSGELDDFLRTVEPWFAHTIVIGSSNVEINELLDRSRSDLHLLSYKRFRIREMGYVDRCRMVEKWVTLNSTVEDGGTGWHNECVRKEALLTTMLGKNLLPRAPLFVLILLQQMENNVDQDSDQSTLGRLYEFMISGGLLGAQTADVSAEDMSNYLTEVALHFFANNLTKISKAELEVWTDKYTTDWNADFEFGQIIDRLLRARMLRQSNDRYAFRLPYVYQFFVARALAHRLDEHDPGAEATIKSLAASLYDQDAANIMVFLCYLSRHSVIIDSVIDRAKEIFPGQKEFELSQEVPMFKDLQQALPKLRLLEQPLDVSREEILRAADETQRAEEEVSETAEEDNPAKNKLLSELNSGYRIVQIAGQILRNNHGTIRGPRQEQLMQACYGVGLRTLQAIVDQGHEGASELLTDLTSQVLREHPELSRHEVISSVSSLVFSLVERAALGVVKHLSNSTGSRRLDVTLSKVVKQSGSLSYRVVECSARLDTGAGYPESVVEGLLEETSGASKFLARALVRDLLWFDFHIFDRDYRTVQRICKIADIEVPEHGFLTLRTKRDGPRGRQRKTVKSSEAKSS